MDISIRKFVELYYGVEICNSKKISHKLLSKIISSLKQCSLYFADMNPGLLKQGMLIRVIDDYNNVCIYDVRNRKKHDIEKPLVMIEPKLKQYQDITFDITQLFVTYAIKKV